MLNNSYCDEAVPCFGYNIDNMCIKLGVKRYDDTIFYIKSKYNKIAVTYGSCVKINSDSLSIDIDDNTKTLCINTINSNKCDNKCDNTCKDLCVLPTLTNCIVTTSNVPQSIAYIQTKPNTVYLVEANIVAKRVDSGTDSAAYVLKAGYKNRPANNLVRVGVSDNIISFADDPSWSVQTSTNGSNIVIQVIGMSNALIEWVVNYTTTKI